MPHYTNEQIEAANSTSLVAFLHAHGEDLKRKGTQYLWERHQVWITDNRWYSHYDAVGGYAISFVRKFYSMSFQDAVAELLGNGFARCVSRTVTEKKPKELVVPKANTTMNCVYAYLMGERCISREVISFFAHNRTLYEDEKYHNCIFVGLDENSVPQHIHRRGTHESFKQTESGSKAEHSFHHDGESEWLFVFEAPIDMLAFITLHQKEWTKHSYVALCSVSERPILQRLKVNSHIRKIVLCLDHDNAGIAACIRIKGILAENGYNDVRMLRSENKDWDEDVKALNGITPIKAESDETDSIHMQRMLRSAYNRKYCEYICVDAIGDIFKPQYVTEHFKVILARNKLKEIRFHDLRHSCASLLLANKVPMKMIQDWLGHSDMGTTANIYSHVDSTSKLETADVIGSALAFTQ